MVVRSMVETGLMQRALKQRPDSLLKVIWFMFFFLEKKGGKIKQQRASDLIFVEMKPIIRRTVVLYLGVVKGSRF